MYTITLLSGGVRSFSIATYSIEYSKAMLKPWEYIQHYGYTLIEIQQCLCEPSQPYDYITDFAKIFHVRMYLHFKEYHYKIFSLRKQASLKVLAVSVWQNKTLLASYWPLHN